VDIIIWNSREVFSRYKERVWWRRQRDGKSSRIEEIRAEIEEFIQEFKRAVRESKYEEKPLVEEFKRGINGTICQKLIKSECQPSFIEQWYGKAIALDRN